MKIMMMMIIVIVIMETKICADPEERAEGKSSGKWQEEKPVTRATAERRPGIPARTRSRINQ